jgi:hypothetical protein
VSWLQAYGVYLIIVAVGAGLLVLARIARALDRISRQLGTVIERVPYPEKPE